MKKRIKYNIICLLWLPILNTAQKKEYSLNDPRNPDCPCHQWQKKAEQEFAILFQKNQYVFVNNTKKTIINSNALNGKNKNNKIFYQNKNIENLFENKKRNHLTELVSSRLHQSDFTKSVSIKFFVRVKNSVSFEHLIKKCIFRKKIIHSKKLYKKIIHGRRQYYKKNRIVSACYHWIK
jgi:hypothetical protein